MITPKSDTCIMDKVFVSGQGLLERWQVYLVPWPGASYFYQVFINAMAVAEIAVDQQGRWFDFSAGYSANVDEMGELIEQFAD
ncbi:hypothetical protein [Foetidibacter luteolus]|uniref:hypothetical protein n=1 Tax=Foetidibacter luteolus TaxID=2608880 RepID=UPI00129C0C49|nr:hypothetical protein [Foetidibacter luteolus]